MYMLFSNSIIASSVLGQLKYLTFLFSNFQNYKVIFRCLSISIIIQFNIQLFIIIINTLSTNEFKLEFNLYDYC